MEDSGGPFSVATKLDSEEEGASLYCPTCGNDRRKQPCVDRGVTRGVGSLPRHQRRTRRSKQSCTRARSRTDRSRRSLRRWHLSRGRTTSDPKRLKHRTIVMGSMEKDPAQRFQSARDLAFALKALTVPLGHAAAPARVAPPVGRRRTVAASRTKRSRTARARRGRQACGRTLLTT